MTAPKAAQSKDIRVLVVDDSKTVRLNVRGFLRDLGFRDIEDMLREDGVTAPATCPPAADGEPPLARYDVR